MLFAARVLSGLHACRLYLLAVALHQGPSGPPRKCSSSSAMDAKRQEAVVRARNRGGTATCSVNKGFWALPRIATLHVCAMDCTFCLGARSAHVAAIFVAPHHDLQL